MTTSLSCYYLIDMSHLSSSFEDKLSIHLREGRFSQPSATKPEPVSQITFVLYAPFKEFKYFRLANKWRNGLRSDDDVKLNIAALKAVDRLKFLLEFSESKVAAIVGVSRNTIRNWRKGQGAYPNTTNKLFQVSHLISALNSVMNQRQMLAWLNEPDDDPALSRLERLRKSDGVSSLTRQANDLLFPPRPGKVPPQDMLVLESDMDVEPSVYAPNIYKVRNRPQVT